MNTYIQIFRSELTHLTRSPFKVIALSLFVFALIYGCQNGLALFKKQTKEIDTIKSKNEDLVRKMILQYEEIGNGTQGKPRRDPTIPYWAIYNTPSHAFKYPSSMMVFSLGQSEQYGYYKRVTNWSSRFDSDLAEEIANPERLAIGTLDFNFVFSYLCPILIIILLFNIGGLERDLKFENLIYLQSVSKGYWLLLRFLFYFIVIAITLFILLLSYALVADVFLNDSFNFIGLSSSIILYLLFWFTIFYVINYYGKGSSDNAIKMISFWLALCIVIPGVVHQVTSIIYPLNYMTDYLDVSREQRGKIFDLSSDSLEVELVDEFPWLKNTLYAADSTINSGIVNRSVSGLVNILNKNVALKIENSNEEKNQFIRKFSLFNPVTSFQNHINSLAGTDYYAYLHFRNYIQSIIDIKIRLILEDTWNKVPVNKDRYIEYVSKFQ
tara:strand:+ start:5298 stop:6614 length:1317 start_codon:yes stop_codon:yes gene_type:complete